MFGTTKVREYYFNNNQRALEGDSTMPKKVLEADTQTKRTDISFDCALDHMFSDFNTVRKAAWLKLTQLQCARHRKVSQMLLHSIRESN